MIEKFGWNGPEIRRGARRMVDEYDPGIYQTLFPARSSATDGMRAYASDAQDGRLLVASTYRQDPRSKYTGGDWRTWNADADGMARGDGTPEDASRGLLPQGTRDPGRGTQAGVNVMLGTDSGDGYVTPDCRR